MAEQPEELKKLVTIASDLGIPPSLRTKAIEQIGNIGSYAALSTLLNLAGNEKLNRDERLLALKYASQIIKSRR